jgi:hypothetical protein
LQLFFLEYAGELLCNYMYSTGYIDKLLGPVWNLGIEFNSNNHNLDINL